MIDLLLTILLWVFIIIPVGISIVSGVMRLLMHLGAIGERAATESEIEEIRINTEKVFKGEIEPELSVKQVLLCVALSLVSFGTITLIFIFNN